MGWEMGECEDGVDPGEPEACGVAVCPYVWDVEDDGVEGWEAGEVDGSQWIP